MEKEQRVLAFDLGGSSGRAIVCTKKEDTLILEEVHRFLNQPVILHGTLYWDILRLFHEMKQGLKIALKTGELGSIAVDTWGVDFGLLGEDGKLLENPIHYRDGRTKGILEVAFEKISRQELYEKTGNEIMEINTAFQLLSIQEHRPRLWHDIKTILLLPNLFDYFFTGKKTSEYSIASTTQLLDTKGKQWADEVFKKLDISKELFPKVSLPPYHVGPLLEEIKEEVGQTNAQVVAVASHDTQSALVAVPADEKDFIFISCGTWCLFGTELEEPLLNENAKKYNLTNEGGFGGKISFLKNIIGLWMIQESKRQWEREGYTYSFGELEALGEQARPFTCFIDPQSPEFQDPGNLPSRVKEYAKRTGQKVPESIGEIVRCINESLAFTYRKTMEEIMSCTKKKYRKIHMVGGGIQSKMLCQMTANACKKTVSAGPVEASVIGNALLQFLQAGEIKDLEEGRKIVKKSFPINDYEPEEMKHWDREYEKYLAILGK